MQGKIYIILVLEYFLLSSCLAQDAPECADDLCKIDNDCRCSTSQSPLATEQTPQFVTITFSQYIDDSMVRQFLTPLLFDRKNPDGTPVSATFFLNHEFSDYERIHELYVRGFEIAVQSISNNQTVHYWKITTEEALSQEFGGMKQIISKFANIPPEEIRGVRTPLFQLSGNISYHSYVDSGFTYENSWPSAVAAPFFPYTLDYRSTQKCREGIACPTEPFEGFWELPLNSFTGQYIECFNVSSCGIDGDYSWISEWFSREVNKSRNGNREPLTLVLDTNWFLDGILAPERWRGLNDFLDHALNYTDTFFVSHRQVIDWIKNPVPRDEFSSRQPERIYDCEPVTCSLKKEDKLFRSMKSCVECPEVYPWVGNPMGETRK